MKSLLIKDTTREEREEIVKNSIDNGDIGCEAVDMYDMYLPYIEGKMELKEISMSYRPNYIKDMEREERPTCTGF